MTIAEWINESPGRMIVIKPSAAQDGEGISLSVFSRALGKKASCHIEVCPGLLEDVADAGDYIVRHITNSVECLIHSIKDRN